MSIDGTSLYHEANAAGVIYQATLRRELHRSLGLEWAPVDPQTGMAEIAGIDPESITAWSQRSSALREWAANNLVVVDGAQGDASAVGGRAKGHPPGQTRTARVGAAAAACGAPMRAVCGWIARRFKRPQARRGAPPRRKRRLIGGDWWRSPRRSTRRRSPARTWSRWSVRNCPSTPTRAPRELVEAAVDEIGLRLTRPRAAHQREGHERFTLDRIPGRGSNAVLDLVDAADPRAQLWVRDGDTDGLSADQTRAVDRHRHLAAVGVAAVGAGRGRQDHLDAGTGGDGAPPLQPPG